MARGKGYYTTPWSNFLQSFYLFLDGFRLFFVNFAGFFFLIVDIYTRKFKQAVLLQDGNPKVQTARMLMPA
jgi:hypothetical protein